MLRRKVDFMIQKSSQLLGLGWLSCITVQCDHLISSGNSNILPSMWIPRWYMLQLQHRMSHTGETSTVSTITIPGTTASIWSRCFLYLCLFEGIHPSYDQRRRRHAHSSELWSMQQVMESNPTAWLQTVGPERQRTYQLMLVLVSRVRVRMCWEMKERDWHGSPSVRGSWECVLPPRIHGHLLSRNLKQQDPSKSNIHRW